MLIRYDTRYDRMFDGNQLNYTSDYFNNYMINQTYPTTGYNNEYVPTGKFKGRKTLVAFLKSNIFDNLKGEQSFTDSIALYVFCTEKYYFQRST